MASSSVVPVAEEFVDVRLPHWRVLTKLTAEGRARVDELSRARKLKKMAYHSAETKSTKDEHFKQMVILGKEIVAICVGEGILEKAVASGVSTLTTSLKEALDSSERVFKRLRTALEQAGKLREIVGVDEIPEPAEQPAAAAPEPAAAAALKPAGATSEELFVQAAALRERARLRRAEEKRRVREEAKRKKAEQKRQQALPPPSRPGCATRAPPLLAAPGRPQDLPQRWRDRRAHGGELRGLLPGHGRRGPRQGRPPGEQRARGTAAAGSAGEILLEAALHMVVDDRPHVARPRWPPEGPARS